MLLLYLSGIISSRADTEEINIIKHADWLCVSYVWGYFEKGDKDLNLSASAPSSVISATPSVVWASAACPGARDQFLFLDFQLCFLRGVGGDRVQRGAGRCRQHSDVMELSLEVWTDVVILALTLSRHCYMHRARLYVCLHQIGCIWQWIGDR